MNWISSGTFRYLCQLATRPWRIRRSRREQERESALVGRLDVHIPDEESSGQEISLNYTLETLRSPRDPRADSQTQAGVISTTPPAPGVDMTSWLHKYGNPTLHRVLLCVVLAANIIGGNTHSGESVCSSPPVSSCSECLRRGPQCAWCFEEGFLDGAEMGERCDLAGTLARRGCDLEFIEHPEVMVEVNATTSSTQVSPGAITITLRPGAEASVIVAVQQLERYPVDLYYLVDVSASMQENLDQLKTVGVALSHRMREHSSDLRLGFGSFVDKPVSPYINVHPSKINNPCSDFEVKCRPAHGFHHVLSMTANMSEFTRVIKRQRISGNMDTPEGGLLPGSNLLFQAPNLIDVVVDAYKVYFNITIGLHSCPDDHDDEDDVVQVFVRPVGYNESAIIKVHSRCRCHCGPDWRCHDDTTHQSTCGEDTPDTDHNNQDLNNPDMHTRTPDLDPEHTPTHPHTHGPAWSWQCREGGSGVDCNGRGVCVCGKCVCERNSLGTGEVCVCLVSVCVRRTGQGRAACAQSPQQPACPTTGCYAAGVAGVCVAGVCVTTINIPERFVRDVPPATAPVSHTVLVGQEWRQCVYKKDNCNYRFHTALVSGNTLLHFNTQPECVSSRRYVGTFLSVCVLTFLPGLVMLAVLVLLLQRRSLPQSGATDQQYNPTGKDLSHIPATNEKTVSYRRDRPPSPDRPMEMHITVPKMPLGEPWQ
ncbi:unnamed protein product [Coregonus sp. 'balchen']|nr:unnamed protein product [Coregonus sp. 'balchen']